MASKPESAKQRLRRTLAASVAAAVLTCSAAGCVGRTSGNDSDRSPGEQNPARSGNPTE